MSAATIRAYGYNGAGPTATLIDSTGGTAPIFGRDDNIASTVTLSIPTATGTHFSYVKWLALYVTVAGTTNISNRRIAIASSPALPTGLTMWQGGGVSTYTQQNGTQGASAGNYPTDSASNGATPANQTGLSWVALTTSNQQYDNTTVASSGTGKNGNYCPVCIGVDNTYAAGGGSATLPSINLVYDEA